MLIKKYNTDSNRRAWQAFLNTQGETLTIDGDFGPATKAATGRLQMKASLKPDGIVGENTLSAAMQRGFAGFGNHVPAGGKMILVSAGHSTIAGLDQGVVANGLVEGKEAVKVRDRVAEILRKRGYAVIEDGADGMSEPLSKALVLAAKADYAIEIHFNAFEKPAATGVEVLARPKNRNKAQRVATAIARALSLPLRGSDQGWKDDTSGQHSRLAFCRAGGLVVETCFLTNTGDVAKYQTNFDELCVGIADAIALSV